MESRTRAYIILFGLTGLLFFCIISLYFFLKAPSILSPLPEETGIKIIYISPQPSRPLLK